MYSFPTRHHEVRQRNQSLPLPLCPPPPLSFKGSCERLYSEFASKTALPSKRPIMKVAGENSSHQSWSSPMIYVTTNFLALCSPTAFSPLPGHAESSSRSTPLFSSSLNWSRICQNITCDTISSVVLHFLFPFPGNTFLFCPRVLHRPAAHNDHLRPISFFPLPHFSPC